MKSKDLKQAIIDASYVAFSKSPYQKVSTNDIVHDAGVSKGLLFHYFKNKQTLYLKLYEMAWISIHKQIFEDFPFENRDVFERLKTLILKKTQVMLENDLHTAFLKNVHLCEHKEIVRNRSKIYAAFQQKNYARIFDDIDESLVKSPEYRDEIFKVVTWTFNKITHEWEKVNADKSVNEALSILEKELCRFTDFFKHYFYR